MLMATGETRTVIRSHGAIDYRNSDDNAGKNRALHRLLSTDTGFQRLCSWSSSVSLLASAHLKLMAILF